MSTPPAPAETTAETAGVLPRWVRAFFAAEEASGIVMIVCAMLALIAANSLFSASYFHLVELPLSFGVAGRAVSAPLSHWVSDILMTFFFLLIGLELKRERLEGVLRSRDQVLMPLVAAMAGMAAPALIFLALNRQESATLHGWAIPSATDIAFALAVLALLARQIAPAAKVFLLAIAIFDDLGAILIIALFYNTALAPLPLALAAIAVLALALLNRLHCRVIAPYLLTGVGLWLCFYQAGIHTTLAGVLVGLAIPMRDASASQDSPLNRAVHFLHPWVSYLVLPVFAFTSAGVSLADISAQDFLEPLPLGIALGLLLGKQAGIFGVTFAMIRAGLVAMPEGVRWRDLYLVAVLAGIGFTMSLFIGFLAFPAAAHLQELVKLGVLAGSLLCVAWAALAQRLLRSR